MVSDFLKKKYLDAFNTYDSDGSGTIEKKDFEASAEVLAKKLDGTVDEEKRKEYLKFLLKIWEGIQQADTNNDGHLSFDEWIAMWDAYAKNPSAAPAWQKLYCKFSFQLLDPGNDGSIDADEFTKAYEQWGVKKNDAVEIFEKMSRGKASISWDEFEQLWQEYFTSEDVNAPGNLMFASPNTS